MASSSTLDTLIGEEGHNLHTILRLIAEDGVSIRYNEWDAKEFSKKLILAALNEVAAKGKDGKLEVLAEDVAHAISVVWTEKYRLNKQS